MRPLLLSTLLVGCPYVTDPQYDTRVRDADGDGVLDGRFGGPDCNDANATIGDCDIDNDGFLGAGFGPDCDDDDPNVHPDAIESCDGRDEDCSGVADDNVPDALLFTFFADSDGDQFGSNTPVLACLLPPGHLETGGDCDDSNPAVHPGAVEFCDALDRDCDGDPTFNAIDTESFALDLDGDGFGAGDPVLACEAPASAAPLGDCDDADPTVSPVAIEVCDAVDNDCDGIVDLDVEDDTGLVLRYQDLDGDGFGGAGILVCANAPHTTTFDGDCEDNDPETYPGAPEICGDTVRQDCSTLDPYDCDSDGEVDVAEGGVDCDDTDPHISTAADEVCDGIDNDCDGALDSADDDVVGSGVEYFLDHDGDGVGGTTSLGVSCDAPPQGSIRDDDCDDDDPSVSPTSPEACNGHDDDCDGAIDEAPSVDVPTFYADGDGDGYGDPDLPRSDVCEQPPQHVLSADDCDDGDASVHPGAAEICDGVDNDCDLLLDAEDDDVDPPSWYLDNDLDGVGQSLAVVRSCEQPAGYGSLAGDCDDSDALVQESITWFIDADSDGFGSASDSIVQCLAPASYVRNQDDCDDAAVSVNPGAPELCDGEDNDCDGEVDDDDSSVVVSRTWYLDADGDGVGDTSTFVNTCLPPDHHVGASGDCDDSNAAAQFLATWFEDADQDGYGDPLSGAIACLPPGQVLRAGDCDDHDARANPGNLELCNGFDDDCDGHTDEPDAANAVTVFPDLDGDGYGDDQATGERRCVLPGEQVSPNGADCDDGSAVAAAIHPGAPELCNGVDDDCDGDVDDDDSSVIGNQWFRDSDGDSHGAPGVSVSQCDAPAGFVDSNDDCNDNDGEVYFSLFTATDSDELDAMLPHICDGGAVLLDPTNTDGYHLEHVMADRSVLIASLDSCQRALVMPPALETRMLTLPSGSEVTFASIEIGAPGPTSDLHRLGAPEGIIYVDSNARLVLQDVRVAGVSASDPLYLRGEIAEVAGNLLVEDSEVEDVTSKGPMFRAEAGGNIEIDGLSATHIVGDAMNQGAILVRGFNAGSLLLKRIVESERTGVSSFWITNGTPSVLLEDSVFEGGRKVMDISRGHLLVKTSRFIDQDAVVIDATGLTEVEVESSIFVRSATAPVDRALTAKGVRFSVRNSVFANYVADVFNTGSTPFTVDISHSILLRASTGSSSWGGGGLNPSLDCTVIDEVLSDCAEHGDYLSPWDPNWVNFDPSTPASEWLMFPYDDFSSAPLESSLVGGSADSIDVGVTAALPYRDWNLDTDDDDLADGWEQHWFGDLDESGPALLAHYDAGTEPPVTPDPPVCP